MFSLNFKMLLEDRIYMYFIEARDRGINTKSILMCSFFEAKIINWGYASRENFRSQKLHISIDRQDNHTFCHKSAQY